MRNQPSVTDLFLPASNLRPSTSGALALIADLSRMDDAEAQSLLEWIVVPVVMQKMVTVK